MRKLMGIAAIVMASNIFSGCSTEFDAVSAASANGWRKVEVIDQEFLLNLTCESGEIAYRIRGENPRGDEAKATVCCGYTNIKGCTIRY